MTGARPNPRRRGMHPFGVGLLAIVGLVLCVYLVFNPRIPFVGHYSVRAVFASSNQLRPGSPVRIAGVNVGQVSAIGSGPGTSRIVTMEIGDQGRPIHTDATVRIRPRVFLEGGFYVELRPGSPHAPELRDRGVIPLGQTSLPVQFHQVLTAFDRPTREGLKSALKQLAYGLDGGGSQGLRTTIAHLAPTLKDVAIVSQAAQGTQPGDLAALIGSTAGITSTLAAHDVALADGVTSLNRTAGALADNDVALAASVQELDRLLRVAPGSLTALDRALPSVDRFAAAIRPALPIAPAVLDSAARVLVQAGGLAGPAELPALLTKLSPALRTLPTLATRLTTLFPLVTPVVTCVRDRAVPVLNAKIADPPISTGRPAWQDFVHALVGLSSASQNFDGNGASVRFLAGAGSDTVSTGSVPGVGQLFGSSSQPILGSRPTWLGDQTRPPFRPDQPCTAQAAPDLHARTGVPATTVSARARAGRPALTPQQALRTMLHPALKPLASRAGR